MAQDRSSIDEACKHEEESKALGCVCVSRSRKVELGHGSDEQPEHGRVEEVGEEEQLVEESVELSAGSVSWGLRCDEGPAYAMDDMLPLRMHAIACVTVSRGVSRDTARAVRAWSTLLQALGARSATTRMTLRISREPPPTPARLLPLTPILTATTRTLQPLVCTLRHLHDYIHP